MKTNKISKRDAKTLVRLSKQIDVLLAKYCNMSDINLDLDILDTDDSSFQRFLAEASFSLDCIVNSKQVLEYELL